MHYIRKSLSVLLVFSILIALSFSTVSANPGIIHESVTTQRITSGAVLEHITRFTTDGWLNIRVLKVELSDPNIKVDNISSPESLNKLGTTRSLAQSRGAVAAINGSFFNWSDTAGIGDPIGPVVESGKIVSANTSEFNKDKNVLATFSIDNLNKMLVDYWKTEIKIENSNGKTLWIGRYNDPFYGYKDLSILDRRWSETSIGVEKCFDVVEMIVDNGKVIEIRDKQPAVEIPVNGYVVVTRVDGGKLLTDNFKVGDSVNLRITTNPDWSKLKMAVTGGAILIKEGQIPQSFSHDASNSGRHPRTAIGSSQDGRQLLLVTVDGRQNSSIGMTLSELAQFMRQLGCQNALNLDGGGSTTMVARTPGTSNLEVVNSPSGGSQRSISNAVGIFSIAPPSALDGLIIDTRDSNIFVNTSREFTIRGHDKYLNPIEVKPDQIKWSVKGVRGHFTGNTFYPTSVGEGKIVATVANITAELPISVLSTPAQLFLNQKSVNLAVNQSTTFTITGKNRNGYYAFINPVDVKWAVSRNIGSFNNNIFTASSPGAGFIRASVGNTRVHCSVIVGSGGSSAAAVKDSFEAVNGSFLSYPSDIKGSYSISTEQKYIGNSSGKLTYEFPESDKSRAAYMVFAGQGLAIDNSVSKVGLWVYNPQKSSCWLAALIQDSKQASHYVYFTKSMDWTGWKYVELSLTGIEAPSSLKRLYVVQTTPGAETGSVYFDELAFVASSGSNQVNSIRLPKDTIPSDPHMRSVAYEKTPDSLRFSVFGQSREPSSPVEHMLSTKLTEKINSFVEAGAYVGGTQHQSISTVKKPFIATNTGYKSFDIQNSRFIQLDMNKQGLRTSNTAQWKWLLDQLETSAGKNIFIFMASSPLSFSDKLEAKLFQDTLTKYRKAGRNIWVFYKGSVNTSYMERGIKYISSAGFDIDGLTMENPDAAKYILVTVRGSAVTFEFKPI